MVELKLKLETSNEKIIQGPNIIKLFMPQFRNARNKQECLPWQTFPAFFVGKGRSRQYSGARERCFTQVGFCQWQKLATMKICKLRPQKDL
jgi:hypothetical protein